MNSSSDLFAALKIELIYLFQVTKVNSRADKPSLCLTCGPLYVCTVRFFDRVLALYTA